MFFNVIKFVIFIGIFHYCESWRCDDHTANYEIKLKNHLFCDGSMDVEEKPDNGTLVKIKLFLKHFEYVDMNAELTTHSWLKMNWFDERLKWEPSDYGGIKSVVVEEHDIWIPKISLFNSRSSQYDENCAATPCHVASTGYVSCIPTCIHNVFCKTNFRNWPFDIQNCTFHMGSWMNKGSEIKFQEEQLNIEKSAIIHNEFRIIKIKIRNNIGKYKGMNDTYPSIHYNIILERHASTEMAFIFTPAIIFAILNLSLLWLAPNCGERIFMIILSMLLHFFVLEELAYLVPKNGEVVPIVLIYFRDSLIIVAILLVETILCRGLLMCRRNIPARMKSLLDLLQGHKVGQFMFENPYLINSGTNMRASNEPTDSANLVENEAGNKTENETTTSSSSVHNDNIWLSAVKLFDTLLFFTLIITYIIMIVGWFPDVRSDFLDEKTVEISNEE